MRFKWWWLVVFITFLLLVVVYSKQKERKPVEVSARVVRVVDGDTIEVDLGSKKESVRLIGIDAPELNECYASESAKYLKGLLGNEVVILTGDVRVDNRDKYGRLLRYVTSENQMLNVLLVKEGFAKEYYFMGRKYEHRKAIVSAEETARNENVGLWKQCGK